MYVHMKDKLQQQSLERKYEGYKLEEDEIFTYKKRTYIPNVENLRRIVMDEIHQAPYFGHPRYHKIIATAKKRYFCPGLKKDITEYISKCMKCQPVKAEHQHPLGLLQPLPVPEWKQEVISMDLLEVYQ